MRGIFALVSLLIVIAVIGFLSKKQMSPLMPTGLPPEISSEGIVPPALINVPLQKLPDQYKKALNDAMQKPQPPESTQ